MLVQNFSQFYAISPSILCRQIFQKHAQSDRMEILGLERVRRGSLPFPAGCRFSHKRNSRRTSSVMSPAFLSSCVLGIYRGNAGNSRLFGRKNLFLFQIFKKFSLKLFYFRCHICLNNIVRHGRIAIFRFMLIYEYVTTKKSRKLLRKINSRQGHRFSRGAGGCYFAAIDELATRKSTRKTIILAGTHQDGC